VIRERLYPPDWLDTDTAAYMVSMSGDTFNRWVEAGTFPKPVVPGGKRLWHRGRLSEALDSLDPAYGSDDDPIMAAIWAQTKERRAIEAPKRGRPPGRRT
jgi:predicted DNA-binding transcriptional regulator AlpA